MTTVHPESRPMLSLAPAGSTPPADGFRHGSRSLMTCFFKCGNACDHPEPNRSENGHIQDEIAAAINRRSVLRGAAVGSGAIVLGGVVGSGGLAAAATSPARGAAPAGGPLANARFSPVAPNRRDAVTVPDGFDHDVIIRWGDPVVAGAPAFDPAALTVEAVKKQFGYNNDYVGVVKLDKRTALMVVNHEYDDATLMYPTGTYTAEQVAELGIYAHGMSVVTIKKGSVPGSWRRERVLSNAPKNRRINADTRFRMTGPAAGHELLRTSQDTSGTLVRGTLNNCSGGMTPWGTILSGEENFNQYFDGTPSETYKDQYARYGIAGGAARGWSAVQSRFSLDQEPHEPHRFGWIVEVDPLNPKSRPVKHTMLGRLKHEGANVVVNKNKRVVAYMGDDERGDYIYKFVSAEKFDGSGSVKARRHNKTLLTKGTLYVARFTGDGLDDGVSDGTGTWIKLCTNTTSYVPGMSVAEVLVFTRLAADKMGPTKMDRPEDVEVNPVNGKMYAALTNNSDRGAKYPTDEPNPIGSSMVRTSPASPLETKTGNRNGYVLEVTPKDGNHGSTQFTWDLMLICGDPDAEETYFAGFDKSKVSRISCPDNLTFDTAGNLWISTDGSALGGNDGLFRVPVAGPKRGQVLQFLTVPKGAECCGPLVYDGDQSLFFAPQHPGEITGATFEAPASTWPHTDDFPRPSVCVAFRKS